ncbi:MAG: glycosyltransferase family 4 protein [Phycisphaerae bacterium]
MPDKTSPIAIPAGDARPIKVVYLAAGAAGMYCGSCMRDNRLAATLIAQGRDITLMPLYTPLRTDETDVSTPRVHYGGINVFLQQSSSLFQHTPWWLDRLLDARTLLTGVARFAGSTRPETLGALTVSVLRGQDGRQRKELDKLIAALRPLRPDVINLANLMFVGLARRLKNALGTAVVCTLSGEDIFLDRLTEPFRTRAFELIRRDASDIDAFIAVTNYSAEHAARHFHLPHNRVHTIRMGIRAVDFPSAAPPERPFTIGYLARICPDKGLAPLCEAVARLRQQGRDCRLRIAGYLGPADRPYLDEVLARNRRRGIDRIITHVGEVTRNQKMDFLRGCHALSVPAVFPEAKGFYILEALAAGVPVVQPRSGAFPELINATGGGLLYDPDGPQPLADALSRLMDDPPLRKRLADQGRAAVRASFTNREMAERTWTLYRQLLQ